jgi:hypothetical protein
VHHSFLKIEEKFKLMIRKEKGFKLMNFLLRNDLDIFSSNVFLILKILNFENVILTNVVHIYVIEDVNR